MNSLSQYILEKFKISKNISQEYDTDTFTGKVLVLLSTFDFTYYPDFEESIEKYLNDIYKKFKEDYLLISITKKDYDKIDKCIIDLFKSHLFGVDVNIENIINAFTEEPDSKEVYHNKDINIRYRADEDGWYGFMITSKSTDPIIFWNSIL